MTATAPSGAEVVVIGAGPGGYVAAIRATEAIADREQRGVGVEHDEPREGFDWLVANLDPADTIVPMQVVEDHRTPAERIEKFRGDGGA